MGHIIITATKTMVIVFLILISALVLWPSNSIALPASSPTFDCDDATLAMYQYFRNLGITSTPIVGNIKMVGETYLESNHVWLLVSFGNKVIAYDWGTPRFDRQHYEGYEISLDLLLSAVAQDKEVKGELSSLRQ